MKALQNTRLLRGLQLALYGFGALAAVIMAVVGVPDARLPWFIVASFSAGCFIDTLRSETPVR